MNRFVSVLALSGVVSLAGCVAPTPKPNDPYYAPVFAAHAVAGCRQ
jgi:flagellar L-ring protein precursor FlgH